VSDPRFLVGIDLGTTHTVVAYADISNGLSAAEPQLFPIPQLIAPGEVAELPLLASMRYHPIEGELSEADLTLPWPKHALPGELPQVVIGALARERAAKVDGRSVISAKSWLCHDKVDRSAAILPWAAAEGVAKVSPVLASASYLAYVRAAWNHRHPQHPLENQDVVITVPASFDEAARALTVEAARLAGLHAIRLLEEPQAVCYDWYARYGEQGARQLADSKLLLVVDIGGGTTDLSLIKIRIEKGELNLTRVGVGEHLMLGGDNIDLALARQAETALLGGGQRFSAGALAQLIGQCRSAKELLLAEQAPDQASVTVLGSGSRLIGGSKTTHLVKAQVQALALDGFFPSVAFDEPLLGRESAVLAFGLPYAHDPAMTRQISAFLRQHQSACQDALETTALAIPDTLLVNGGVFNSPLIQTRIRQQITQWRGSEPLWLENGHPDLAVAYGAVAYAMARRGAFRVIQSGAARGIFLRVQNDDGVCLLPRGSEEGREIRLHDRRFSLRVGQPIQLHLTTSNADSSVPPGALVKIDDSYLSLPPLIAVLPAQGQQKEVEVELAAQLTEVGTVQIDAISVNDSSARWQVEFQLRKDIRAHEASTGGLHPRFAQAKELIEAVYGAKKAGADPNAVKQLRANLEKTLGPRAEWDMALSRALADLLLEASKSRRRSLTHERVWFNLVGYCMRPGFGHPLDSWRIQQLWPLHAAGLQFFTESQSWSEWWTLWRRVAGGLDTDAQMHVYEQVAKFINPASARQMQMAKELKLKSYDDMARLTAVLENLSAAKKVEVGNWMLKRLEKASANDINFWCLGRIGGRIPFHGSAHNVVPAVTAAQWITRTLQEDWQKNRDAGLAAVTMSRLTADRERDIDDALRQKVLSKLSASKAPEAWSRMVAEVVELSEADSKWVFGETLPAGLKLLA